MHISDPRLMIAVVFVAVLLWGGVLLHIYQARRNAHHDRADQPQPSKPPAAAAHEWDEYGTYNPPIDGRRFEEWR